MSFSSVVASDRRRDQARTCRSAPAQRQPASEQTRATVIKQLDGQAAQQQAEREFGIRARDREPMWAVLNAAMPVMLPRSPLDREAAVMGGLLLGSPEFQRR